MTGQEPRPPSCSRCFLPLFAARAAALVLSDLSRRSLRRAPDSRPIPPTQGEQCRIVLSPRVVFAFAVPFVCVCPVLFDCGGGLVELPQALTVPSRLPQHNLHFTGGRWF